MDAWQKLNDEIIHCERCERLVQWRVEVGNRKVKRFRQWVYWSRPMRGFGDRQARLLIVGLAPAAHGGNRTGRIFTGDRSGEWLFKALYETGFASQPVSYHYNDSMRLQDAFITAVCRCAPPQNQPQRSELQACQPYLQQEIQLLKQLQVILTLGGIATQWLGRAIGQRLIFQHGAAQTVTLPDGRSVLWMASYHPSQQNTFTKRLTWPMWISIFQNIRQRLDGGR